LEGDGEEKSDGDDDDALPVAVAVAVPARLAAGLGYVMAVGPGGGGSNGASGEVCLVMVDNVGARRGRASMACRWRWWWALIRNDTDDTSERTDTPPVATDTPDPMDRSSADADSRWPSLSWPLNPPSWS